MAFEDIEGSTHELIRLAEIGKALRAQMAENLRLAHICNAAWFKALRSCIYQPEIHHFEEKGCVFVPNVGENTRWFTRHDYP
jgi:hypothetical protein